MEKIKLFLSNWKTTVPGLLALLCATDSAYLHVLPPEWEAKAGALCIFLVSIGLIAAKDGDKTNSGTAGPAKTIKASLVILCALVFGAAEFAHAQTTLKVQLGQAKFGWVVGAPDDQHSPATKHTIVCGNIAVDVPMPATEYPVNQVVTEVGVYNCSLFASNDFGRQTEPNIPFPVFEAGLQPLPPNNLQIHIQ